ncbi:Metal dependent phosphohydrolase [Candidatus Sulfotelmatobacter kueseliae]|uniref:Metal dependent phosphohydrolase n=1 Tax=Candidatus Sulfotelmatobacter kueseliae TaxID=2042962 RepID=A0A2U3KI64_9BACT|nr:Metal dependent phosphohydrolase [Candidatus Sulfotelmatobacter kueseliae]
MAIQTNNFRRLLHTVEALSELGPALAAEHEFSETARRMLAAVLDAAGAREGVLFLFNDKPAMLTSAAAQGFALMPDPGFIPLLPKHVHALTAARGPIVLNSSTYSVFLSSNGNVAPELFKCIAPLRTAGRLAGVIALGRRPGDALYEDSELDALEMLCSYVALAVQNHALTQTIAQRVSENLRLMASLHGFYDNALEAFATAIDVKHVAIHGHSLRVGRYAAAIGEAMGMEPSEVAALRSAGYLHDIGKVAVDRRLFGKPSALDPEEFREMADHTVVGHQIVSSVQFPWPRIPEAVRWHHERSDGSGYPDRLGLDDLPMAVRIVGVADSFDAMTSVRPYRGPLSVGSALSDLVRIAPQKLDPNVVQALLIQVRRDVVGSSRTPLLDGLPVNIAAADIDQLAATLQHKVSRGKAFST